MQEVNYSDFNINVTDVLTFFNHCSHYKNKIEQKPGWHSEMLKWCLMQAKESNLKEQDFWGGFVLDEMKIQVDIFI